MLSSDERRTLLALARESLAQLDGPLRFPAAPTQPALLEKGAAFVTLRQKGTLCGCMGHITAVEPLWKSLFRMARAAATEDPRFPPLQAKQIEGLEIELSILSPMTKISEPGSITIGKNGLFVERGSQRGLLLPQVAEKYKWGAEEFLKQTCLKADLPADSWMDSATSVSVFLTESFGGSIFPLA